MTGSEPALAIFLLGLGIGGWVCMGRGLGVGEIGKEGEAKNGDFFGGRNWVRGTRAFQDIHVVPLLSNSDLETLRYE